MDLNRRIDTVLFLGEFFPEFYITIHPFLS